MGVFSKASNSNDFSISGPNHLTSINWNNLYHRTAVTSSLVNGVYTMQKDKAKKRESIANPWWEFFDFCLVETLINEADSSIYGAVFKYNKYDSYQNTPDLGIPPRYVIAFRGTIPRLETGYSDIKQILRCIFDNLNDGRRCEHAIQAIKTVLAKHKTTSIWLAGHSLGAGIALLAGKAMKKSGFLLETYAFNPPNSYFPLRQLFDSDVVKGGFRIATSCIKATAALLFDLPISEDDPRTAAWAPYLYVNPEDKICAEYIDDFKIRNFMSKIGASKIESAGAIVTLWSLISQGGRGEGTSSSPSAEPIQHLSSADMTVNMNKSPDFMTAHGLEQWWERDPARRENWKSRRFRPSI